MTRTRPVPPTLRRFAIRTDADDIRRFAADCETVSIGVTAEYRRDADGLSDAVRVKPRDVPDGFRVAAVTSRVRSDELITTVQFRPE